MGKSKKKRLEELRHQREGKRIMNIVLISTLVLIVLLYIVYVNS
jgi:hypothetical protein